MKKNSKKNQEKFTKEAIKIFHDKVKNAELDKYIPNAYNIKSKYGDLYIRIDDKHNYCYSIFTKFDNPDLAKEKFDCNPYSGKYNFHINDIDWCLKQFSKFLDEVII